MGEQSNGRLTVASLDPRSLFPTVENINTVTTYVVQVQAQLEADRAKLKQFPDNDQARASRNETLAYMALLNDWINQAKSLVQHTITSGQTQQQQQPRRSLQGVPKATVTANVNGVIMDPCQEGDFPVLASSQHPPENRRCILDINRGLHYVQIKKLRDTIYGSVKLYQIGKMEGGIVRFSLPAEQVAIKMFDKEAVRRRKSRDGHSVQEDPIRELGIQQRLSNPGHRFVMPLLACLQNDQRFYAVYPFVGGGELFDFVSANSPLPEQTAKSLMRGMLDGVHYCHMAGICHRDISLENFLLGGPNAREPLLIDFGLSVVMEPDGPDAWLPIQHTGAVGKQFYMAPEIFANNGVPYDGRKADVWSLGVSLAIMLTGVPLWECPSSADDRFRASIIRKDLPRVLKLWGFDLSSSVLNLLQRMLELDPSKRASIVEISQHDWLR